MRDTSSSLGNHARDRRLTYPHSLRKRTRTRRPTQA
jgi:hypothetical protein